MPAQQMKNTKILTAGMMRCCTQYLGTINPEKWFIVPYHTVCPICKERIVLNLQGEWKVQL